MTTMTYPQTTIEEDAARWRKVVALAGEARARGIRSEVLGRLDDDGWNALAGIAQVRFPSARTRAQTVAYLHGQETAAEITSDPFAGL